MTWATLDIDGRAERVSGFIIASLQHNKILGKGRAERNVSYEASKKFQSQGSDNNAIKDKESGRMKQDEINAIHFRCAKKIYSSCICR